MNSPERFRNIVMRRLGLLDNGGIGTEIKVTVKTSTYNPRTSKTEVTEEEFLTSGIRMNYKLYDLKNTSIQDTDVQFYISPTSTKSVPDPEWEPDEDLGETEDDRPLITITVDTPQLDPTYTIEILDKKYTVVNCHPWNHSGILIGYKAQGRVV